MSQRRAKRGIDIGETVVKYGGRTLKFEVLVNTDEAAEAVAMRLKSAAQGAKLAMVVTMGGVLETEDAEQIWERLIPLMNAEASRGGTA